MGKGDSRSRKGKIFKGSYGKVRPHVKRKSQAQKARATGTGASKPAATKTTSKKK